MRSARIIETTQEYKLTAQLQDKRLTLTLDVYKPDHTVQHIRVLANGLIPRIGTIDRLYSILMRKDTISYQVLPGQARIIFQLEDGGYDLWLGNGKLVGGGVGEPASRRRSKKGQISAYELGKIVQRKLEAERQEKSVKKVIIHYEKEQSEMIPGNQNQGVIQGQSKSMEEEGQPQPNAQQIQNRIQLDKKQEKQIENELPMAVDIEDEVKSEDKAENGPVLHLEAHKDTDQPCYSCDQERERKPTIGATNTRVLRPRHKKEYREDSQRKEEKIWNHSGNRPKKVPRNTPQTAIQLSEQPQQIINLPIKLQFEPVAQPQPSLYYQLEIAREQIAALSKTIEQLKFIVVEQGYEIQRVTDLNRHYSMLLAQRDQGSELGQGQGQVQIRQVNGRFKSKSVRKREEIGMREWQISMHCANYENFDIEGLKVTLRSSGSDGNSQWSILYLNNPITKDKPFTIRIRIHRSNNKNIAIGIGALKNQQKKSSWNQKQCIEYIGSTRAVVQNSKSFFESGYGIGEGDEIAMRVDCGRVSWCSERGLEAELQYGRFLDTRDRLVPFVRMKDVGDCVEFIGRPQ